MAAHPSAPSGPDPGAIAALSAEQADRLLERLERDVPVFPALLDIEAATGTEAVVFGDSHGDWRSSSVVAGEFLADPAHRRLVGLGDYVDRAPEDCPGGSVVNALYLLDLAARHPGRVVLLQGNHETVRRFATLPHDLPEEVDELWGPEEERYQRIVALLERGPLAALSSSGAFLAHAGFPSGPVREDWRAAYTNPDDDLLLDTVWREAGASRIRRGVGSPFTQRELDAFLRAVGASVFLRGHDPDLNGKPVFGGRCLTLHTSRVYERYGGVLFARFPLAGRIGGLGDVHVERIGADGTPRPVPGPPDQ